MDTRNFFWYYTRLYWLNTKSNPHMNVFMMIGKNISLLQWLVWKPIADSFCVYLSTFSALIIFHILIFKLTEGVNTKLILSMETNTKGFFFAFRCHLQITHRIQKKLCYYFNTASYFEVSFFHGLILIWRIQLSFYPLLQYQRYWMNLFASIIIQDAMEWCFWIHLCKDISLQKCIND